MNPLFQSYQSKQQPQPNDFMTQLNGALNNLLMQIAPTGMTAEQIVRQKIQNREMTQEQFSQYASIADMLTGVHRK